MNRPWTTRTVAGLLASLVAIPLLCGCAGREETSPAHALLQASSAAVQIEPIGGEEVAVEFVVASAKDRIAKHGIVFLDSHTDFKDPKNLCVALSASAAEQLRQQGIADLEAHFFGKRIRARGSVMLFEERRYLPVLSADHIEIGEEVTR